MSNTNTGGPAFPILQDGCQFPRAEGMTLRQYAAIHLKVPNSGTEWLDDMIRKAQRDDFASKAMQAVLTSPILMAAVGSKGGSATQHIAKQSYEMADAMMKARGE